MVVKEQPSSQKGSQTIEASLGSRIEDIVEHNLSSGRFQRVCNFRGRKLTLDEYTDIVTIYYAEHHHLVSRLAQGEKEAWEQLSRRLFSRAYTLLLQRGWDPEQAYVRAQEAVQDTCLSIYCRVYPYDCPFDAWVFTILRHYVFRSYYRPRNPLDLPKVIDSLDELPEKAAEPADPAAIEQYEPLLLALGRLRSIAQKQVIECLFFQELSSEETAHKLGKTTQAVYNLKGRALAGLCDLLKGSEPE